MTNEPITNDRLEEPTPERKVFGRLMRINRLSMMLHHERMAQHGPHADPMRGQGRVLALLQVKDGLATRDMANILAIRPSSLNETLARLERDGMIERRPNEADKRQPLVYLTEQGRAQDTRPERLHEQLFDGFEPEELEQLDGYLARIEAAFLEALPEEARDRAEAGMHGPHRGPHHGPESHRRPDLGPDPFRNEQGKPELIHG